MENLSIGAVARMTGLSEFTLRAWEKRYRGIHPTRMPSGRRVYTMNDVKKLSLLRKLTELSHPISDIVGLSHDQLADLLRQEKGSAAQDDGRGPGLHAARAQVDQMLQSVKELGLFQLAAHLRSAQMQYNTRSFLIEIVALFLRDLGERVKLGKLDVYHEHAASAVVRNFLTGILFSTEQVTRFSEREPVVFATPEGDHHEFGILITALLTTMRAQKVLYLGPNMPLGSIERAVKATKSPIVVLGISAPRHVLDSESLDDYVSQLVKRLPGSTKVWIGGERVTDVARFASAKRVKVFEAMNEFDRALADL